MPVGIQILLALLAGVGLGIFIGWLLWRGGRSDSRLENELRQQIGHRESELDKLRGQISETGNARAAAEAKQGAAEKLLAEQRELQAKALADLREAFQGIERGSAEAKRAGISAAGGTVVR